MGTETGALIESFAEYRWSRYPVSQGPDGRAWDALNDEQREYFREQVRAALAFFPPGYTPYRNDDIAALVDLANACLTLESGSEIGGAMVYHEAMEAISVELVARCKR